MAKRKKTHPDRKTNKQYKPPANANVSNLNNIPARKEDWHKKSVDWKKLAVHLGIPGLILTLIISYASWTISTIYDLKKELACIATELACYEQFVDMNYGMSSKSVEPINNVETEASG